VSVAPYLIPGVGEYLGAVGAIFNLAKAFPTLAKTVNGIISDSNDEDE
jgi:hypothetical protein